MLRAILAGWCLAVSGGARVLLIPQDPAIRCGYMSRTSTCAQNGQFEISAVRPGEYYGIAIAGSDPNMGAYRGAVDDGLLKEASRVSVGANESTSAEIRLIAR